MNRRLTRAIFAAALFLVLAALALRHFTPSLPTPLTLDLFLAPGIPDQAEPLIVSGRASAGDFLFVQYVDATHIVFGYDSWGHPRHLGTTPIAITPGQPLRLRVVAPFFSSDHRGLVDPPGPLVVECNGASVLSALVHYYPHRSSEIFIGQNPLGGTACAANLQGRLLATSGRELRGGPQAIFTPSERLFAWLRGAQQPLFLLLLSASLAFAWPPLGAAFARLRAHRWSFGTVVFSAVVFSWLVTQGEFRFLYPEEFGSFYDYQAASLLQGRLDVPDVALAGEAFLFGGKIYGYFGPTPSLLRLPFIICDLGFGELSRSFLVVYFTACLTAAYLLLRQAYRFNGNSSEPSAPIVILSLGSAGLGSTLFFLGSRAYIYHEAILCGAAFALFAVYFALRYLSDYPGRWWLWSLLCGILSLHARPPTGLFALTLLGGVSIFHVFSLRRQTRITALLRPIGVGVLCVIGVVTFNGLSYLKFKTFEGAPLRYSRPYDHERLAKIEGRSFHAGNLPSGFYTYLVRPNLRVEPSFPWIYHGAATPPHFFTDAKIDLAEHTNSLPFAMPSLFALTLVGCAAGCRRTDLRQSSRLLFLSVLPMSLALFSAVATSHRYTGDFVPFLICAGAFGWATIASAPPLWRYLLHPIVGLLTAIAIFQTFAVSLHFQRHLVWGVAEPIRENYQRLRHNIDGLFHRSP